METQRFDGHSADVERMSWMTRPSYRWSVRGPGWIYRVTSLLVAISLAGLVSIARAVDIPEDATAEKEQAPPGGASKTPEKKPPGLLRDIAGDLRHFPSSDTLRTLGVGGAVSLAVGQHDRAITESASQSPALDHFFEIGGVTGNFAVQGGAAFAVYIFGRLADRPGTAALGRDLVRAQVLSAVVTQAIKVTVRRVRRTVRPTRFPRAIPRPPSRPPPFSRSTTASRSLRPPTRSPRTLPALGSRRTGTLPATSSLAPRWVSLRGGP